MSATTTITGLGARSDHVATVPHVDAARLRLTPEEGALLRVVGRVARIDEVLTRSGLDEPRAIALLLALRAKGAIAPARVGPAAPALDAAAQEDVDLEPARKQEILQLERALDRADHFQVLGLAPGAPPEDVKRAFYDASRRYHPDRYYGKNLGSFRARIDRIFKRLAEAHAVLTQPERRAAYLAAHPELSPPAPVAAEPARPALSPERQAERAGRLARHPYLLKGNRVVELLARARQSLARGEFELVYVDLNQVLQLEPRHAEATQLLGEARRRHDAARAQRELERAREREREHDGAGALAAFRLAATLDPQGADAHLGAARLALAQGADVQEARALAQRAVELAPRSAPAHHTLALALLQAGAKKLARRHLEEVLALDPDHADARAQLRKLRWPF